MISENLIHANTILRHMEQLNTTIEHMKRVCNDATGYTDLHIYVCDRNDSMSDITKFIDSNDVISSMRIELLRLEEELKSL